MQPNSGNVVVYFHYCVAEHNVTPGHCCTSLLSGFRCADQHASACMCMCMHVSITLLLYDACASITSPNTRADFGPRRCIQQPIRKLLNCAACELWAMCCMLHSHPMQAAAPQRRLDNDRLAVVQYQRQYPLLSGLCAQLLLWHHAPSAMLRSIIICGLMWWPEFLTAQTFG